MKRVYACVPLLHRDRMGYSVETFRDRFSFYPYTNPTGNLRPISWSIESSMIARYVNLEILRDTPADSGSRVHRPAQTVSQESRTGLAPLRDDLVQLIFQSEAVAGE